MGNTIWVFAGIAGLVIGAAAIYVYMDRKAKGQPLEWSDFGKVIAMAQAALGNIFTEAEVEAVARYIYHRWSLASDFYSEDQWTDLFKSVFPAKEARGAIVVSRVPELSELDEFVQDMRQR